jgi:hypothetical protein
MNVTTISNIINSSLTSEQRAAEIADEMERQAKRARWERRKHNDAHPVWRKNRGDACALPRRPADDWKEA